MFPYRIVTEWSEADGVYVARVPALSHCTAHGDTAEAATREATIAGSAVVESLRASGQAIPDSDVTSPPARVA